MHREIQIKQFTTMSNRVTCVCARSGSRCIHTGRRSQRLTEGVSERNFQTEGADATFQAPTEASANQIASCKYPIPFMQHQRSM